MRVSLKKCAFLLSLISSAKEFVCVKLSKYCHFLILTFVSNVGIILVESGDALGARAPLKAEPVVGRDKHPQL